MENQRIIIEILGGDMDGRVLDSAEATKTEKMLMDVILHITDQGTVGGSMTGASLTTLEAFTEGSKDVSSLGPRNKRTLRVIERLEEGSEVLIRMQYSVE